MENTNQLGTKVCPVTLYLGINQDRPLGPRTVCQVNGWAYTKHQDQWYKASPVTEDGKLGQSYVIQHGVTVKSKRLVQILESMTIPQE